MVEIRAVLLPRPEPMTVSRSRASLADVALRPLRRGLIFLAALSLPVLGCALADRFHGGASEPVQGAAVPLISPQSGAAAISLASPAGAGISDARFAASMSLR